MGSRESVGVHVQDSKEVCRISMRDFGFFKV